jgi:AmmeMemoRadiSam system protein A
MLSKTDKKSLLQIARKAIEAAVRGLKLPKTDTCSKSLMELCGAFVTLHKDDELRGCIGYIEGVKPLVHTVQEVAIKSALEDPRFMPVTEEELSQLEIEISVISPMKQIKSIEEIEVGKHGLLIEQRGYRGLLLPQVATEYGWDKETFLNQTARKAGLPTNAWKDSHTIISIFSAEIFNENEFADK